jgi:hypothetical protein
MYRTFIAIGLSLAVGIGGTLFTQWLTVTVVTPVAGVVQTCPEPATPDPRAAQGLDTTYTPQGQAHSLPRARERSAAHP